MTARVLTQQHPYSQGSAACAMTIVTGNYVFQHCLGLLRLVTLIKQNIEVIVKVR